MIEIKVNSCENLHVPGSMLGFLKQPHELCTRNISGGIFPSQGGSSRSKLENLERADLPLVYLENKLFKEVLK